MRDFGQVLRSVRKTQRLTQTDLAKKTGLLPAAISHFECGRRSPSIGNLRRLASTLNISVDWLLDMYNYNKEKRKL